MAGTGMSVGALGALRTAGRRVLAAGPTVQAARNVGGATLHSLFGIHQPEAFSDPPPPRLVLALARRVDALLVDEVFLCTEWMLAALLALRRLGVALLLAGDPDQLPPVQSAMPAPRELARSALMHELVDGRVCALECPRRSRPLSGAPSVFALCAELLAAPCDRAANARFVAQFRHDRESPWPERNLAYLNATCLAVNTALARRRARGRRWLALVPEGPAVLAGAWALRRALAAHGDGLALLPTGAPLVARSSAFFPRGSRVRLAALDEAASVEGPGGAKRVPLADLGAAFELGFCTTIHRAQCATIDEPYALHDVPLLLRMPPAAARPLLYVACSRATGAQLVRIVA
jgi:ATP-dependent exoDNAse (exonuclease V) alpha subunit